MQIHISFLILARVHPASVCFVPRTLALSPSKAAFFVANEEWGSREEDKRRIERRSHAHAASEKKDGLGWRQNGARCVEKKDVAGRRQNGAHTRTLRQKRRTGLGGLQKNGARGRMLRRKRRMGRGGERMARARAS
jgi:hypothetical protein